MASRKPQSSPQSSPKSSTKASTKGSAKSTGGRPPAKKPVSARPAGRSAGRPGGTSKPAPQVSDSSLREAVANRSKSPLAYLTTLPRYVIPGAMLILMLVGLAAPTVVAVPALLLILAFVTWLGYLSWPVLSGGQRAIRVVAIAIVALAAVGRITGWL